MRPTEPPSRYQIGKLRKRVRVLDAEYRAARTAALQTKRGSLEREDAVLDAWEIKDWWSYHRRTLERWENPVPPSS